MPLARTLPSRAFAALLLAFCFAATLGASGAHAASSDVTGVAAGWAHTCVIDSGSVKCWGSNIAGQLGDPATAGSWDPQTTPFTVPGITNATAIAAGYDHTCVIEEGAVKCWGNDASGQVGDPATSTAHPTPYTVTGITNATAIAAGYDHTCAIEAATVKCWGSNLNGQLGDFGFDSATPRTVEGVTNATALSTGLNYTCAIDSGAVKCWGNNEYGQLGDSQNSYAFHPDVSTVSVPTGATALGAGDYNACAIAAGAVYCWGMNDNYAANPYPFNINFVNQATAVAAGNDHTCVIEEGAVKCWGYNGSGQVGGPATSTAPDPTPRTVTGVTDATALTAAGYHTCAVDSGAVKCWGDNSWGQVGNPANVGTPSSLYTVDLTAPDAPTVTAPEDGSAINDNTPTLTVDTEPGATVTFTLDGTTLGDASADSDGHARFTTTTALADGDHSVQASVADAQGNRSGPSVTNTFTLDTKAPDTPVLSLPDGTVTNDPATGLDMTAEPNAKVHILLDGAYIDQALAALPSGGFSLPKLWEGEHTMTVTLIDRAGNSSEPASVHYTLDTAAPDAPALTFPADGGFTNDTTPTLKAHSEPGATVTFAVDGTTIGTATADNDGHATLAVTGALTDAQHTVKATATDTAGNVSTESSTTTFTVDTAAPAPVTFTQTPERQSTQPTATFAFSGEPGAQLQCSLDGADWNACTSPVTFDRPSDGPHTLRVRALDQAGNVSAEAPYSWTVDTTPTPDSNPTPDGKPNGSKVARVNVPSIKRLTVAHGRFVTVGCRLNAGALTSCQVTLSSHGKRIGRATRRVHGTHRTTAVRIKLNAAGRRLLARTPHGSKVTATAIARTRDGHRLRGHATGRLYRARHRS